MPDLAERQRLSRALNELDSCIHSSLSFDEIMQTTLDGFVAALEADAGDIKLLADDGWNVRYVCGFGHEVVGLHLDFADAPVANLAKQAGEPVTIEDFSIAPVYAGFPRMQELRAVMSIPLVVRQQVIGCLFAWMREVPRAFSPAEIDFGRRVAASVALALANARLLTAESEARKRAQDVEHDLAKELERTRVLLRASDELLTTTDSDELLRRLSSIVLDATGLSRVFVNLLDMRQRVLIPKIATGGLAAPMGDVIPFAQLSETSRRAIAGGRPAVLDYECPETPEADRAIAKANDARLVLFVPLMYRGSLVGHITVDQPGERYDFSNEQVRVLVSVAALAASALQNARLAAEHAVEVLEQQLLWMAYGLHDGPVQTLSAAAVMLEQAARNEGLDELKAQTAAAAGLLDHALFEMREIMRELRPDELEEESLVAKIRQYVGAFEERWSVPVKVEVIGSEASISHYVQVSLFRVVQEALSNARKHANAQSVEVGVRYAPLYVECTVRDDGRGFVAGQVRDAGGSASSHWGLASMGERMLMIGGELEIESVQGEGTEVRARAPLDTTKGTADEYEQ